MIPSTPVLLSSRDVFANAYICTPPAVSEITFSSLFGWQTHFNYHSFTHNDLLVVFYKEKETYIFLPPLLLKGNLADDTFAASFIDLAHTVAAAARAEQCAAVFRYMPTVYTCLLPTELLTIEPDRDSFDYVYLREDLANLPGQAYAPKRNLIHQCKNTGSVVYEEISERNLPAVQEFINCWHTIRRHELLGSAAHCLACRLTEHYTALGLVGGILRSGGTIVAATMGAIVENFLYDDGPASTVIVHHENALTTCKGSYQMINQQFCAHLPSSVRYVNREEDMGLPGLRKAKLSYQPARMVEKYTVTLKRQTEKP